jgi:hypothetical protein
LFTDSSRSVVPDHTAPEPAEPVTEPAHPKPAATARTVAAGILFAALGAALAASAVLVITAFRLLGSGDARLDLGGPPAVLLAVAFAAGNVAALLFLTRDWAPPRAGTAAVAFVVAMAWPLSGIPLPAGLLAMVAIGLALSRDRRVGGGRRITGWGPLGALAAAGFALAIAGAALAESHPTKPPKPVAVNDAAPAGEPTGDADASDVTGGDATSEAAGDAEAAGTAASGAAGERTTSEAAEHVAPGGATGESAPSDAAAEAPRGGADLGDAPGDAAPNDVTGDAATGEPASGAAPNGTAGDAATGDPASDVAPSEPAPPTGLPTDAETPSLPSSEPESAPLAQAPAASLGDPKSLVRAYYRALDEKRFDDAWKSLSPAVRTRFGGFGGWKAGYAKTLYSKPRNLTVTTVGSGVTVKHLLVARDQNCSGERRFSVTWTLRRVSERWSVTGLTAAAVGANTATCR